MLRKLLAVNVKCIEVISVIGAVFEGGLPRFSRAFVFNPNRSLTEHMLSIKKVSRLSLRFPITIRTIIRKCGM